MGYEVQMLVGKVCDNMKGYTDDTKDKSWFQIYANVDLCKPGSDAHIMRLKDDTDSDPVYMYAIMGDGDTQVVEDKYGDTLNPIPIQDVLEALYKDQRDDYYRRFRWAIALLESMRDEEGGNLSVAFWGY